MEAIVYLLTAQVFFSTKEGRCENYRPQNIFRCRVGREERRLSKLRKLCKLHTFKKILVAVTVSLNFFAVMRCLLNFFTVLRCSEPPHVPLFVVNRKIHHLEDNNIIADVADLCMHKDIKFSLFGFEIAPLC